jgi:hypothetical protein
MPWVVVAPNGVHWLGHAQDEAHAWSTALGWPDASEVAEHKQRGWYAAEATVSWKRPDGVSGRDDETICGKTPMVCNEQQEDADKEIGK